MSDRERIRIVAQYADLQKQIEDKFPKVTVLPPTWASLKYLLCSMEPMVYDMEQSESVQESPCHKYTKNFLNLVNEAKLYIGGPLKLAPIMPDKKLVSIRERLKTLFRDYVEEELVAGSIRVADEQVEMELKLLVRYLGSTIRYKLPPKISKWPVLRNIDIILDHLKQESDKRDQLELLNEVKLLLKFVNGDHGMDIPNHLLNCEQRLREDSVTMEGLARLKKVDQEDEEKSKMENLWILLIVSIIAIAISYPPKSPINFLVITIAVIFFCAALYGLTSGSSSNSTNSNEATNLRRKNYDVFLNFCGSDVRYSLPGLLHNNLEKANIRTFFDERSARKSKRFLKEIEIGISTSVCAITIFTENYGKSKYCLDELVDILEQEKARKDYIIRPIFFDVEPEDLPKPDEPPKRENRFRQGFNDHYIAKDARQKIWEEALKEDASLEKSEEHLKEDDRLGKWEEALKEVVSIGGDPYNSRRKHMDVLIDEVVKDMKAHVQRYRGHTG